MYTQIATAKLNRVDPQAWLADVLRRSTSAIIPLPDCTSCSRGIGSTVKPQPPLPDHRPSRPSPDAYYELVGNQACQTPHNPASRRSTRLEAERVKPSRVTVTLKRACFGPSYQLSSNAAAMICADPKIFDEQPSAIGSPDKPATSFLRRG